MLKYTVMLINTLINVKFSGYIALLVSQLFVELEH